MTLFVVVNLLFPQPWLINLLSPFICPNAVYFVKTEKPLVALTIDDSPDINTTQEILDILAEYKTVATFFPITSQFTENQRFIKAMVDNGHEIGNHLTKDELSIELEEKFESSVKEAHDILSTFTTIKWLRPGGGFCNERMVEIAQKYNYQTALASVWAYDTHIPSSNFAFWFILANTKPGSIIVLHDVGKRGKRTITTLKKIIPSLQKKGYKFVTLSELNDS